MRMQVSCKVLYCFIGVSILETIKFLVTLYLKSNFVLVPSFCYLLTLLLPFELQKVTVIAMTVASPVGRRKLFAQINSFIAIFILAGQLSLTV